MATARDGPQSLRLSWPVLKALWSGRPVLEWAVFLIFSHPSLKFQAFLAHPPKKKAWSHPFLIFYFLNQALYWFCLFCRHSGSIRHPSCLLYVDRYHPADFITCTCFTASICETLSKVTICILQLWLSYILTYLCYKILFVALQCYNVLLWWCWLWYFSVLMNGFEARKC